MIKIDIKNNGFHHFSNNFFELNKNIIHEFMEIHKTNLNLRSAQNVATINNLDELKEFDGIKKIFDEIIKIFEFNDFKNIKFDDVWFVNSNKSIFEKDKLPYIPHIDKIRKLKVMIYLNDVKIENGPIHFAKVNPNKYENFRKKLNKDYKIKQENEIKDIQLSDYKPLIGEFGTTIFFDTNTPHFAGKIEKNLIERKVIRFNFISKDKKNFLKDLFRLNNN
jgi:hypothetical protein